MQAEKTVEIERRIGTALARLRLREVVTEPPIGRDGSVQDW